MVHGVIKFQGVQQGCLLSPLLLVDGRRYGIQWTLWNQRDDLDFEDDIALLSHKLAWKSAAKLGLTVSRVKRKTMRSEDINYDPLQLENKSIEEVTSIASTSGGTNDVEARIAKSRAAFNVIYQKRVRVFHHPFQTPRK